MILRVQLRSIEDPKSQNEPIDGRVAVSMFDTKGLDHDTVVDLLSKCLEMMARSIIQGMIKS